MRRVISLSTALLLLCLITPVVAQETVEPAVVAAVEETSETPQELQIVQMELWVVRLTPEANAEIVENAGLPLKDRKAVLARIRDLEQQGRVECSRYCMASTLDGQQVHLHVGAREPRVRGMNLSQRGRTTSVEFVEVGMIVQVRPKVVSSELISFELNYEESYFQRTDLAIHKDAEGDEDDSQVDRTLILTHQANAACPNGGAVTVMASGGDPSTEQPAMLMLLACRVMD